MDYIEFLIKYSYPQELINIAKGLIKVPDYTIQAPANLNFGFPPVLIPLWSNGSWPGYIGIAKHWFGNQPETYVEFYVEEFSFVEIAKNMEQLKAWMVFDFLCNIPSPSEVARFAESIGFCAANEVEGIFAGCDDVSDLAKLSIFKHDLPAVFTAKQKLDNSEYPIRPSGTDHIKELIRSNRLEEAWHQLNSAVIDNYEIGDLLNSLGRYKIDNGEFQDLIASWSAANLLDYIADT